MHRAEFLNAAGRVQGGIVVFALALAWLLDIDPWRYATWSWRVVGESLLATVPPLLLFAVTFRWPVAGLRTIKQLLLNQFGPPLVECYWWDIALVSLLAGLGEELLFRAVLQPALSFGDTARGIITAALLFGLLHAVSRTYVVIAALLGIYLGWLVEPGTEPSIWRPILVHTLYDFVVLLVLREAWARRSPSAVSSDALPGVS